MRDAGEQPLAPLFDTDALLSWKAWK